MNDKRSTALTTLAAAACIALALGGVVSAVFAPICFLFILFKCNVLDRMRFQMPDLIFVLAHAMLFVFFLLFAILNELARDDLAVLLGFATLWMVLRMFAEQTPYNDFLIVLSSLVISVGSAAVAPGLVPVVITALYLIAFCYSMPTIMSGRRRDDGVTVRLVGRVGGWGLAGGFAVHHLSLGGLLLGSVIYLAVPRLQADTAVDRAALDAAESLAAARQARTGASAGTRAGGAVSGFPGSITIGDIGEIKRSNKLAFHAEIKRGGILYDPRGAERSMLLLRADAWDTYQPRSRSWTRWETHLAEIADGTITEGRAPLHYDVELEGYDGRKLFVPQRARTIRCAVQPLFLDLLGRITSNTRVRSYRIESDIPPTSEADLQRLRPGANERLRIVDEALRLAMMPYARSIGMESRPHSGQILQCVRAIKAYFARERFRYTLRLPALPKDVDPIVAFLQRREGHCELYASAACMFLRMAGIPARLAGGVRCAKRLRKGYYQARFRNAHAWVEIACKNVGFVAFDFTPSDDRAVTPRGGDSDRHGVSGDADAATGAAARDGMDWSDPFRYGHEQQRRLVNTLRDAFGRFILPGIGLMMALLIGISVARQLRKPGADRLRVRAPPGVPRRTLSFYVKWLRRCAEQGHRRRAHQTPREFLNSLPPDLTQLTEDGRDVTAKFENLRYGSPG